MDIRLYTRRGCHLCELAEDLVALWPADVRLVDVDGDAAALSRYDLRVPVLEIDGRVVLEGRFDERALAAAFAAAGEVRGRD
ncbi:MAG: glutaredoxin family protein [Planctomycetota bacterium]